MKGSTFAGLALILGSAVASFQARAADGAICYSQWFTSTYVPGATTTTYAQMSNNTKFTCANPNWYTFQQLSQAGWIIDNVSEDVYQTISNPDGSQTTKLRFRFTIQK